MIKALSDNIQALIEIRGIQVGKLEKQLGVSVGYFSRVRRGMSISSEVLYKLSKAVDVSMDDLCSEGYKNRLIRETEAYQTGYEEGRKDFERPKGKWITAYSEKKKKVNQCRVCAFISIQGKTIFCPNCGAEMRKEGEVNEDS